MELQQKSVKGVFWSFIQNAAARFLSFAVFAVLGRLLAPEAFGLVALGTVFISFLEMFVAQGFSAYLMQREELEPEHLDTAFWANVAAGVLISALLVVLARPISQAFDAPPLTSTIRWLSLSLVINSATGVQIGLLSRDFQFRALAIRTILGSLVGGGLGIAAAFAGMRHHSLVIQILASQLVSTAALWASSDWRPRLNFSWRHFKELVSYGAGIVGSGLVLFFGRRFDNLVVGYFLGPITLGFYNVGQRILQLATKLLAKSGDVVAFSAFARLQRDEEALREAFYRSTEYGVAIAFPAFLGLSILAKTLIVVVVGSRWQASGQVLSLLALAGLGFGPSYINAALFKAVGRPGLLISTNIAVFPVAAILIILASRVGIGAVAAAYTAGVLAILPVELALIKRLIGISYREYLRRLLPFVLSTCSMSLVLLLLKDYWPDDRLLVLQLMVAVLLGALTYLMSLRMTAPSFVRRLAEVSRIMLLGRRKAAAMNEK